VFPRIALYLLTLMMLMWRCTEPALASAEPVALVPNKAILTLDNAESLAQPLRLPYKWDTKQASAGHADFEFDLPPVDDPRNCALFIPRIGMQWRIWVGNGRFQMVDNYWHETTDAHGFSYARPRHVPIGQYVNCSAEGNKLRIELKNAPATAGGLAHVYYGDTLATQALYDHQYRWNVTGGHMVAAVSGVLGLLALLVWSSIKEIGFLSYAVAEISWAASLLMFLHTENAFLPSFEYGSLNLTLYGVATTSMCAFLIQLIQKWSPVWTRMTIGMLCMAPILVAISVLTQHYWVCKILWESLMLSLAFVTTIHVGQATFRAPQKENILASLSLFLSFLAGTHDWWITHAQKEYFGEMRWLPYSWLTMGLVMATLLAQRLRYFTRAVFNHESILTQRMQQREVELTKAHEHAQTRATQEASQQERLRILRDMHDGLGADLSGALMQAKAMEKQQLLSVDLVTPIQRALDHLKISIDAMQEDHGDIATIVGQLRHRIGMQFEMAGIGLAWRVDDLPVLAHWDTGMSRDLTFLLYEALSNLLVHAGATQAWFEVTCEHQAICIRLRDNGLGLPQQPMPNGHGMRSMQERARRLGADLSWHLAADPRGTSMTLRLAQKPIA